MKSRKIKSIIATLVVSILFLCSCSPGKTSVSTDASQSISYDRDIVFDYASESTQNYNMINEIDSGWNITDYRTCHSFAKQFDSENSDFFIGVSKDYYAILNESYYINKDSELNYRLSLSVVSDTLNLEIPSLFEAENTLDESKRISLVTLSDNVTNGSTIIASIDVCADNIYLFFNAYDEDFELIDFLSLVVGTDGIIKDIISFNDYTKIQSIEPLEHDHDHEHEEHITQAYNATLTGPECFVLWNNFSNEYTYINIASKSVENNAIADYTDSYIRNTGKTESGIPVFEYSDSNGNLTIFLASDEIKKITTGRIDPADSRFLADNGLIYYVSGDSLYCWDVAGGICQKLYVFDGLDYCICKNIHAENSGNITVMFYDSFESKLFEYELSCKDSTEKTDFVIYKYNYDDYINNCAADFSRMYPSVNVIVKTIEEQENSANMLAQDIKEGKGPDIIVAHRSMMSTLEHVGLLKKLDGILDSDVEKNLFAGVLNNGMIGDDLYGITYTANIYTIAGIKGLSANAEWNYDTLMSEYKLIKANDPSFRLMAVPEYVMTPDQLLLILLTMGLDYSPYIDLESNTCRFDSDEFIELLTFLKEAGDDKNAAELSEEEVHNLLSSRKAMLTIIEGGFISFSYSMSPIYKYCDIYGFPFNGGTNILTSYDSISVSSFSDKDELTKAFVNLALSEECQIKYGTGHARKDVLVNHVYEHTDVADEPIILIGGHNIIPLSAKEDNSSFIQEYIQLMDNSVPVTVENDIQNIIMEEASAYFDGAKSAEEVAKLIQSRVKLYLEERK